MFLALCCRKGGVIYLAEIAGGSENLITELNGQI